MVTPELVPIRLAPAFIIAAAVFQSLIPPLALTCMLLPTVCFINRTSSMVAPPLEKPVLVLTKSALVDMAILQASIFSFSNSILKVIIETCLLTEKEKMLACKIAMSANADFVKTSTGFSSGGATIEDVRLMKQTVGDTMQVKASGGIKNWDTAAAMMNAGASRIGTSSGVTILENAPK